MAKPLNTSDTSYSPIIFSDPISFPGRATKKRAHDYGDDGNEDDSQKTRRVNPHRLAARLGPEIVADMEALIYPGAKMPSFEVRRVIQERYSVDRRHIYDYFHSRGLRVAKEDRHLNLTRGRLSKTLERQTARKPPVASYDTKRCTVKTDLQSGENEQVMNPEEDSSIAETQTSPAQAESTASKHPKILENAENLSARNAKVMATGRITDECFRTFAPEGVSHLVKDRPLTKRRKMAFARSKPLVTTPFARTRSSCLVPVPVENAWFNVGDDFSFSGDCGSPELSLALCDIPASPNTELFLNDYQAKTPVIIEEHRALTQTERLELYNFINDSIGISSCIMEQAGTYTAYMKERTQNYFDRIGSSVYCATKIFREVLGGLSSDPDISANEDIDYENWLSNYIHDSDENYCAVFEPFEDKAIPPQHGSTVRIQESGYTILPSRLEPLHSDCAADLPAITSQFASPGKPADRAQIPHSTLPHQRRQNARLRLTSFVQKTTSNSEVFHNTSNLKINGRSELSKPFPDHDNRMFLHISRPRLRTSSAGGGL